jgi:hypothetical protein
MMWEVSRGLTRSQATTVWPASSIATEGFEEIRPALETSA